MGGRSVPDLPAPSGWMMVGLKLGPPCCWTLWHPGSSKRQAHVRRGFTQTVHVVDPTMLTGAYTIHLKVTGAGRETV